MPTYQYACTNDECGNRFEQFQAFTDAALTECPVCGQRVRKVYGSVGVVFKGSGFYRNDSRDSNKSTTSASSSSSDGKSTSSDAAGSGSTNGSNGSSAGASKSDAGSASTPKSETKSSAPAASSAAS